MKVIDLLNKIANGKELPKKIKWLDITYVYSEYDKDYLEYPFSDEYKGLFNTKDSIFTQYLNNEIEIIEDTPKEDKNIKKIDLPIPSLSPQLIFLSTKINEIIDKVNGDSNE